MKTVFFYLGILLLKRIKITGLYKTILSVLICAMNKAVIIKGALSGEVRGNDHKKVL